VPVTLIEDAVVVYMVHFGGYLCKSGRKKGICEIKRQR
jgi:hypothetical protein